MTAHDNNGSALEIRAMAVTMEGDSSMRFAYVHGQRYGYVTAELPRDIASGLLTAISDALLEAEWRGLTENVPSKAAPVHHTVTVDQAEWAQLIKERDDLRDQNQELLDQVQCLQWDLGALQSEHELCSQPPTRRRR